MTHVFHHWFEMRDIRKRDLDKSVWIPLRAACTTESEGTYGHVGFKEAFFGAGSIAVLTEYRASVNKLGWTDLGNISHHAECVEDGSYIPADTYRDYSTEVEGIHLVLDQLRTDDGASTWHLHQDLVLALKLKREVNTWVCPPDGYVEAARLQVTSENEPALLEIKAEYLKDYLCARGMGLYISSFFRRDAICEDASAIPWKDNGRREESETGSWEGRVIPIHEGGYPFGATRAVFHVARTDVHESVDVPDMSAIPTNENTTGESWEQTFQGRKLYRILGELWRSDWIEPGRHSIRVRGDSVPSTVSFTIDAGGSQSCGESLTHSRRWLWFKPDVVMALAHRRGGTLSFYTRDTGSVSASHGCGVHFGVNDLGLVNVYAKDIGSLPEWQQRLWAGYNVTPEGGVSKELLASQVNAKPADTQAPESFLPEGIQAVKSLSQKVLQITLFREHQAIPDLLRKVHRFRALDEASLLALAKDTARLTADSLDTEAMQSIVPPPNKTKWGSLKSLENLLTSKYPRETVRIAIAPLVGVYELRHGDAHLPSSSTINDAFRHLDVDRSKPFVHQACMMLGSVVSSLYRIVDALQNWE